MHTIYTIFGYWLLVIAGIVIGYVVAVANIGLGREDDYQRGFQDGMLYNQFKSFQEPQLDTEYPFEEVANREFGEGE